MNTPPSDRELEQLLAKLNAARQYWSKLLEGPRATQANAMLSALEGVAAKCNLLLGRTDEAIDCLECAESTSAGPLPLALIMWGDILSQRGDPADAREKWQLAAKSEDARNPGVLRLLLAERLISHDKIAD
jgi:predicted negative regulator of RcsB-dependent stress response